jgi:hypothetical protein
MLSGFSTQCRARRSLRFLNPRQTACTRAESGYALVMAMFLILAMIVSSQVVLRSLVTVRRRQREEDAIWRGEQYVRAIRLYYHKTGHYPQSLEDLQKGLPELHFLRFCAGKDPTNTTDGSWRFIYVNGTGAIIGSVRYATLQQMALIDLNGGKLPGPQPGTPAADLASGSGSDDANATNATNATANSGAQAPQPQQGQAAQQSSPSSAFNSPFGTSGAAGATSIGTGLNAAPGQAQATNPLLLLKPTGPVDGPVLGAFITGVASKVDRPSLRVYKGGKKYIDWEFIWNPLEDQARAVQNGLSQAQGSQQQQPGQFGLPIGPVNGAAPGQPEGGPAAPQQAQPPQAPPPASNPN